MFICADLMNDFMLSVPPQLTWRHTRLCNYRWNCNILYLVIIGSSPSPMSMDWSVVSFARRLIVGMWIWFGSMRPLRVLTLGFHSTIKYESSALTCVFIPTATKLESLRYCDLSDRFRWWCRSPLDWPSADEGLVNGTHLLMGDSSGWTRSI